MSAVAACHRDDARPEMVVATMLGAQAARGRSEPASVANPDQPGVALGHRGVAATPDSDGEVRPVAHGPSGCVLTADIRLDNRAVLLRQLGIDPQRGIGDAELALHAYLRWGPTFGRHLLGAFAIVVWDPRSTCFVLIRDHMGVRPLIYHAAGETFVAASTVAGVAAGMGTAPSVNEDKLLHALVNPLEASEPETTVFTGVLRVPAASYLVWSPSKGAQITSYWRMRQPPRLDLGSDADYAEAFADVLTRAIRCRSLPVAESAAMSSAGLDSAAVVTFSQRDGANLSTYSAVETVPGPTSDTPHIAAMIEHFDLAATCLNEHDIRAACDLHELLEDPDSVMDTSMAVLSAISHSMGQRGQRALLTGIGGDELLTTSPVQLARSLARAGQMRQAFREISRVEGKSAPLHSVARSIVGQLLPRPARQSLHTKLRRRAFEEQLRSLQITGTHADRLRAANEQMYQDYFAGSEGPRVSKIMSASVLVGLERYDRVAARRGVEVRHPFADTRVIEFCLSLPTTQIQRNGWSKWVLRQSLLDWAAPSVIWRPKSYQGMTPFWDAFWVDAVEEPSGSLAGFFTVPTSSTGEHYPWASIWWAKHRQQL